MFPFINNNLMLALNSPIHFRNPHGGGTAYGYPATMLADICDAILAARKEGALRKQQERIGHQAEILVRGFARVGIIALVDEATGYQRERAKDALATILIPAALGEKEAGLVYASEADVLNKALFEMTAAQWRTSNPDMTGNIRYHATVQ